MIDSYFFSTMAEGPRYVRQPTRNNSIVEKLFSRTLSGRTLDLAVHQHLGYRLHLVWDGRSREMRVERRFKTYADVSSFCWDLVRDVLEGGGLEGGGLGLNDCVAGIRGMDLLPPCDRLCACSQKVIPRHLLLGSWIRTLAEEVPYKYWCWCHPPANACSSDELIEWNGAARRQNNPAD